MNNIEINYLAVLFCGIAAMVIGSIWYGAILGKRWMRLTNIQNLSEEQCKEQQKGVWKLYLLQFVLALFQAYVLAWYVGMLEMGGVWAIHNVVGIWIAFIMPTVAGLCMWSGYSKKDAWARFWIQTGYYLLLFLAFGWILGMWK